MSTRYTLSMTLTPVGGNRIFVIERSETGYVVYEEHDNARVSLGTVPTLEEARAMLSDMDAMLQLPTRKDDHPAVIERWV